MPRDFVRFSVLLTAATVSVSLPVWAFRLDPADKNFYYPLAEVVPFSSPFGWRTHPITGEQRLHSGVDLAAAHGALVQSAHSGTVVFAGWKGGYGKTVIVSYPDEKYKTLYAHLSELLVTEGQVVRAKDTIGRVGSSGNSTGPHLHFELRRFSAGQWVAVNAGSQLRAVEAFVHAAPPPFQPAEPPTEALVPAEASVAEPSSDSVALSFELPPDAQN